MDKYAFYLAALRQRAHYRRAWMCTVFSIGQVAAGEPEDWDIQYLDSGLIQGYVPGEGWIDLGDSKDLTEALYDLKETITIQAGAIENVFEETTTNLGTIMINAYTLIPAFGDKIPYQNITHTDKLGYAEVRCSDLESLIVSRLVDDPVEKMTLEQMRAQKDKIYVTELQNFSTYANTLGTFLHLWGTAIAEKSLSTHPGIRKRRAELLKEYEGQLHDPAIQARIQDELIAMDHEYMMDGEEGDFYISERKDFNTARKRMFVIHGPESGYDEGGDAPLVIPSLDEGWDMENFGPMVNSMRAGSRGRGAETALGGEVVKFMLRIFQNSKVVDKDCKVTYGWHVYVDSDLVSELPGFYHKVPGGPEWIMTTKENAATLLGKTMEIRTPLFCRAAQPDFCFKCIGEMNTANPNGIGSASAEVGSAFMGVAMSAAHAKELKTSRLRYDQFLR